MVNKKISKELFLYLIVGALTTGINFFIYYIMVYLGIDYKISNTAAFIVSVIFAFITNKRYVFNSDNGYLREFIKFSAGRFLTYILDISMIVLLVEYLEIGEYIAKLWVNIFIILANYFISKFWTFK